MEKCVMCSVSGEKVRLFDAICDGRMERVCERCSIIENVPIIKKPEASQLKEAEKGFAVYKRMRRLSGMKDAEEEKTFFIEDKLGELDKKPELELPEKEKMNLIEHYHWEIMKNRRRKGLSQRQLAEALGESEAAIQMIEKAKLPENIEVLVRKLEQFFQVKLRRISEVERIMEEKKQEQRPVLLDEQGEELDVIPEPEIESIPGLEIEELEIIGEEGEGIDEIQRESEVEEEPERDLSGVDIEKGEFDIDKANVSAVRIGDLKELSRRKIEVTKQEKVEEQRKIEERQRLIEARKEEIRLKKEKESRKLDEFLGGAELLKESEEDFEKRGEFDEELV